MKSTLKHLLFIIIFSILSCGVSEEKEDTKIKLKRQKIEKKDDAAKASTPSETIDLINKGFGPVTTITLNSEIDQAMVVKGENIFKRMCSACHKVGKKFIGPQPNGILKKRTPEWIMNMILNPEGMVKNDPLAKSLLKEFNGSPMVNQNLSKEEARAILEYFRTLN